jgi:hypothetical protein
MEGAGRVTQRVIDGADAGPGAHAPAQQPEDDGEGVVAAQRHHAGLEVGVQPPGRPDPTPGQQGLHIG